VVLEKAVGGEPPYILDVDPATSRKFHQVRFCRLVVLLRWPTLYGILTRAQATYIVNLFPAHHFWYLLLSPRRFLPDWGRWICRGGKPG
jgi:hypothetical protein